MAQKALYRSDLHGLPLLHRGKVRDIYAVDDRRLLIVTTDRLSAFDVVMTTPIPGKGRILTAVSNFWFDRLSHIVPNHLTGDDPITLVAADERPQVVGRTIVVKRLRALPLEAIVRGYLVGSGWKDYQNMGKVCGIILPPGLRLADRLPEPVFTPSTKAAAGGHDENADIHRIAAEIGRELTEKIASTSLALYREAAEYALTRGIIIADTKFEFGLDATGTLYLIDEALTPDSSRFWPADQYRPGSNPPSFDKQYVRDWLEASGWDKQPPPPPLPEEVIARTADKYSEAFRRLTGSD
jgi:phosphoribosylaminoimidazole-succinocarboxamide synthase